jgi:hypothetical protein
LSLLAPGALLALLSLLTPALLLRLSLLAPAPLLRLSLLSLLTLLAPGILLRLSLLTPAPLLRLCGALRTPTTLLTPLIISRHTCSLRIPLPGALLPRLPAGCPGGIVIVVLLFLSTATEKHECHPQNNDRYNESSSRDYKLIIVKRCLRCRTGYDYDYEIPSHFVHLLLDVGAEYRTALLYETV